MTAIVDLKRWARQLLRHLREGDDELLSFVNHKARQPTASADVQLRHVLAAIARHLGFRGWSHLTAVLAGEELDQGTLLHPFCAFGMNTWSADYDEAHTLREQAGGFLLPYKRQFVIVQADFIDAIGLSATDPDWKAVGYDLAGRTPSDARSRLLSQAIEARIARLSERVQAA